MKYSDVAPIKTRACSAWIVTQPDGTQLLELWSPKATIAEVASSFDRVDGSKIQHVDTGIFKISKIKLSYSPDSRIVDTSLNVF